MKITDINSFPVCNGQRNILFVVVDTDEAIYGVGESGLSGASWRSWAPSSTSSRCWSARTRVGSSTCGR